MHLMMSRFSEEIDVDSVLQLLQMQPDVLLIQDDLGCTPLHTLLRNIQRYKYRDIPADWQQKMSWYLTGITSGLLTRDQIKRLMELVDAENLTPMQYYMQTFCNSRGAYHFGVLGRELGRIHACW